MESSLFSDVVTHHDPLVPSAAPSAVPPTPIDTTDAPYLPPSQPSLHRATVSSPLVPPTAVPPFGLVDATTHLGPFEPQVVERSPGAMPAPTIVGLHEARAAMRRGQRRAALIGWAVSLALFAGVVVGGYFGFQEWQADQTPTTVEPTGRLVGDTKRVVGSESEIDRTLDLIDAQP